MNVYTNKKGREKLKKIQRSGALSSINNLKGIS
jgi:hypothetical protein